MNEKPPSRIVNWRGRTVRQVREEHDLHIAFQSRLDSGADTFAGKRPREVREDLSEFVKAQQQAGRLALSRPARTPLGWRMRDLFHCAGVPIVLLMIAPLLVLYLPIFACQLRRHEKQDLEIAPPPDPAHVAQLAQREDHGATNQFSAFGSVKPGLFRRYTLIFILWIINYTTRHIYNRGNLARVGTIHFARWVFLNERQRLLFASNYDGSLESYMSDFIDKVAWGLNSVFSNGVGYPATNWLIKGGAKDEQKFKYYIRRHQLITDVWYNAYPGLTAFDLRRNALIRAGLERAAMTDAEIREWLALI